MSVDTFGCFGKLPVSREFLVEGSRVLSESRFDRWVGEGIGLSKARLGPRYDEKVMSFPVWRFLWTGGTGTSLLAGAMKPSLDGAGRRHPMSAYLVTEARGAAAAGPLKPVLYEPAVEQASGLIAGAAAANTPPEVLELVRKAPPPRIDRAAAESACRAFASGRKISEFFDECLGDPGSPLRYQVMQAFAETVDHFRSRNPKDIRVGLRCPVTAGNGEQGAMEAAFWVDMIARRMKKQLDGYNVFRSCPAEGSAADLLFFFAEPSGTQWIMLIDRDVDIESVSCLDRPYGGDPVARMEPQLKRLMESPDAVLGDLLTWAEG